MEQRGVCDRLKEIPLQNAENHVYRHASNQQTRNTTCRNIQYCYLLWSRKKVQSIEITLK